MHVAGNVHRSRRLCPRLYSDDRGLSPDWRKQGDEGHEIPRDHVNPVINGIPLVGSFGISIDEWPTFDLEDPRWGLNEDDLEYTSTAADVKSSLSSAYEGLYPNDGLVFGRRLKVLEQVRSVLAAAMAAEPVKLYWPRVGHHDQQFEVIVNPPWKSDGGDSSVLEAWLELELSAWRTAHRNNRPVMRQKILDYAIDYFASMLQGTHVKLWTGVCALAASNMGASGANHYGRVRADRVCTTWIVYASSFCTRVTTVLG